ncbi:UNVERIFIED_ORG: hypothetical protein E4P37_17110 [Bacillus sp. AZ43]
MSDSELLATAYRDLLEAAATVAAADTGDRPADEWDADQVLAHVSLVTATTLATVAAVASGTHALYDNRIASDGWTIGRLVRLAGGSAGLRDRIRAQGEALCALRPTLTAHELDSPVPARLVSGGEVLLDQAVALGDLLVGLAEVELPGHTAQLLALSDEAATTRAGVGP